MMVKDKGISNNDFTLLLIISLVLFMFSIGVGIYNDQRIDRILEDLDKEVTGPCHISFGDRMFIVGMPKGNGEYGYYFVEPSFRDGTEVEYTRRNLLECDGTRFNEMILEIEINEKLINDVSGRKHDG